MLGKWGATGKPFWECLEEIDVGLSADALVSIFRFTEEEDSIPSVEQALQPEMSFAVKISAIKAIIPLLTEASVHRLATRSSPSR